MRAPSDMPRRVPRQSGRRRGLLIGAAIVLFVLVTSLRGIASFYTDFLWFESLGQEDVFTGVLGAKVVLALIFTGGFFVLLYVNLLIADRVAPQFRPAGPEEELLERYHDLVAPRQRLVRVIVALLLALIAGLPVAAEWKKWVLFVHGGSFGIEDPQFHRDIGFYIFRLPFLSYATGWVFAALLIVLIVTGVAHYLNGGIRVQTARQRVTPHVKVHLSVLLALIALVKSFQYYFVQRFELTSSTQGVVDGGLYTAIKAQLPAIYLLLLISLVAAGLFIVNIFLKGWVLPSLGVGLWALVAVLAGGIYPQFVQRVQVQPQEDTKERPYIERNIFATREALGLGESNLEVRSFAPIDDISDVDLRDNLDTVRNIRLWDPQREVSGQTFQQLQGLRDYYVMRDVDVDRYDIDGETTQVAIATRDLRQGGIPQDSWVANHVTYTHGYGVVVAPSTASTSSDEPDFIVSDVPVQAEAEELQLENPRVYFGEDLGGFAIVSPTEARELDYQAEEGTQRTAYTGEDGVKASGFIRQAAFALRFGDLNPLISRSVTGDSRVLMMRDVRERAEALAPFLHFDNDPYPVVHDGRIKWMLDAYTTSDSYPYAQRADTNQLDDESGLHHRFNYVRNSVKAVVDAYDGTVDFYVMPTADPIIDAYREAFPELFKDFGEMPPGLRDHIRYPEDMFRVQTAAWARYHLDDPADFYTRDESWVVALDATPQATDSDSEESSTTSTSSPGGVDEDTGGRRVAPYYQYLQLPEEDGAEFVLLRPFSPFSRDDSRKELSAFMVARIDGDNYGQLIVYETPVGNQPDGPGIVSANIQSIEEVSRLETLLGSPDTGSAVRYGNLLLIPVDDVLVYVQPFYVEAREEERRIPQLRKVIAVVGNEVAIADTLGEALTQLFGENLTTPDQTSPGDPNTDEPDEPDEPTGTPEERAADLLEEALQLFDEANDALAEQDFATYGEKKAEAEEKVADAAELLGGTVPTPDDPGDESDPTTSTTERATA